MPNPVGALTKIKKMHSPLEKAVAAHKLESMPSAQWQAYIKANAPKSAKKEALAVKLDELLARQPKVTKAEIVQHIKDNSPKIKTKLLKNDPYFAGDIDSHVNIEPDGMGGYNYLDADGQVVYNAHDAHDMAGYLNTTEGAKYSEHTLPGGQNYQELLLSLPRNQSQAVIRNQKVYEIKDANGQLLATGQLPMSPRTQAKLNNNPDWVVREFEQPNPNDLRRDPANFQSGHYDDPNILAHMRMNDRPTAEGKKALFLEELQSDWAQKGRKEGFDTGVSIKYDPGVDAYRAYDTKGNMINLRVGNESFSAMNSEQAVRDALANSNFSKGIPRAPYVEDTGDWTGLGLKKAIEHAVEQGHDSIAWTTGAQQADRYNLAKQIDSIHHNVNPDGTYSFSAIKNGQEVISKENLTPDELADHLGKDVAGKIVKGEGGSSPSGTSVGWQPESSTYGEIDDVAPEYKTLSGLDLEVGGEGMRGYYDQIVPQTANDILKSMGVTERVKPIGIGKELASPHAGTNYEIRDSAGDLWNTHRNAEDAQQYVDQQMSNPAFIEKGLTLSVNPIEPKYRPTSIQQGFDITPEIRDYVLNQGLPAFGKGGIVKAAAKEMSELTKLYHGGRKFDKWEPRMIGMGEGAGHPRPLLAQGPGLYAGDLPTLAKIYLPYGGDHPAMTELSVDPTNIIDYYNYKNITPEHKEMIKEAESRLDKYGLNTTKYGLQNAWLGGRYPAHELVRNTLVESGIGGLKQNLDKILLPGETRFGHEFSIFNPDIIKRVRTMDPSEYAGGGIVKAVGKGLRGMAEKYRLAKDVFLKDSHAKDVVYHGTSGKDFSNFKGMTFLTDSPHVASSYSGDFSNSARVLPLYASIKNPLIVEAGGDYGTGIASYSAVRTNKGDTTLSKLFSLPADEEIISSDAISHLAKESGHDGVIFKNLSDIGGGKFDENYSPQSTVYVTFNPNQIKSAVGNKGTFDPNESDILKARGGVVKAVGKGLRGMAERYRLAHEAAQKNAVELLGLPPGNTAMDRAKAMGYVGPEYHTTDVKNIDNILNDGFSNVSRGERNFSALGKKYGGKRYYSTGVGNYTSDNPFASEFTAQGQRFADQVMLPLMIKKTKHFDYNNPEHVQDLMTPRDLGGYVEGFGTAEMNPSDLKALQEGQHHVMEDWITTMNMKKRGYTGTNLKEPQKYYGGEGTTTNTFDNTLFRSKFGAFDPAEADSRDLLKAKGGVVHMSHGGDVDYDELYEFKDYGNRETGEAKDTGTLGEIRMPNGRDVMTEYSINVDGREMPSIVEGMHPADVNYIRETGSVPQDAVATAVRSANKREASGQSPFWNRKDRSAFAHGGEVDYDKHYEFIQPAFAHGGEVDYDAMYEFR